MRCLFLAVILEVLPVSVLADNPTSAQVAQLEACVAGSAGSPAEVEGACSAQFYAACHGSLAAPTTIDYENCQERKYLAWDALLNHWWEPMKIRAQAGGTWDGLLEAQRQWIRNRDGRCEAVNRERAGGSIAGIARLDCLGQVTGTRAVEFHQAVEK